VKKVAIVGGGIAGLGAAEELTRHGFAVTVLEARNRLGGRIHTVHRLGIPVELGAEFVHGRDPLLWKLLRSATLATHAVADSQLRVDKNGALHPQDLWESFASVVAKINVDGPDESFAKFLERAEAANELKEHAFGFVEGFNAANADLISAQSIAIAEQSSMAIDGDNQFRVHHGYSALVDCLVNSLKRQGVTVRTQTEVTKIDWTCGHVALLLETGTGPELFEADAAVVTLPLGVLQAGSLEFDPPLPEEKIEAIHSLQFGAVTRMALIFRDRFWPEDFGFVHALQEEIPTWWSDPRGNIITGWAGGPKAERLPQRADELKPLAIDILARIFQTAPELIREGLLDIQMHSWLHDPLTRGAYSYVAVGGLDAPERLAQPLDGTFYFAGEATVGDGQIGTVHGALASGIRAARELESREAPRRKTVPLPSLTTSPH